MTDKDGNIPLSEKQFKELKKKAERFRQRWQNSENVPPSAEQVEKFVLEEKGRMDHALEMQQRNTLFNLDARRRIRRQLDESKVPNKADAILALMTGSESRESNSAMARAEGKINDWNGYFHRIEAEGKDHIDIFTGGKHQSQLDEAAWALSRGDPTDGMDPAVVKVAQIMNETYESMRADMNGVGAFISKNDSFVRNQSHDMDRIRGSGGVAAHPENQKVWREFVIDRLDTERTFGFPKKALMADETTRFEVEEILNKMYDDLSTGTQYKSMQGGDGSKTVRGSGIGTANRAKQISKERILHFQDGKSFAEYQSKFGVDDPAYALEAAIRSNGRSYGMMDAFGPNYKDNLQGIVDDIVKSDDIGARQMLGETKFQKGFDARIMAMEGQFDVPANQMLAAGGELFRTWNVVTKLGGAFLSMFSDVAHVFSEAHLQSGSMSEGMHAAGNWFKQQMTLAGAKLDQKQLAASFGVTIDKYNARVVNDIHSVDVPTGAYSRNSLMKWSQKLGGWFNKASLMGPGTNAARLGWIEFQADYIGRQKGKKFADLDEGAHEILQAAGINEAEWKFMETAIEEGSWGNQKMNMMTPEGIINSENITGLHAYMNEAGIPINDTTVKRTRNDMANKLRSYYMDSSQSAVIQAKTSTSYQMKAGQTAGTVPGELWKSFMQFKGFPMSFVKQRIVRAARVAGKNVDRADTRPGAVGEVIHASKMMMASKEYLAANFVGASSVGMLSMWAKDLAANREFADPTEGETWMKAIVQGGTVPILADLFNGDLENRYGGGAFETLAGPMAQGVSNITNPLSAIARGDIDLGATAKGVYKSLPFSNLFYGKAAMDTFIINNIMDSVEPGSVQKAYDAAEKRTGQAPLFGPHAR